MFLIGRFRRWAFRILFGTIFFTAGLRATRAAHVHIPGRNQLEATTRVLPYTRWINKGVDWCFATFRNRQSLFRKYVVEPNAKELTAKLQHKHHHSR